MAPLMAHSSSKTEARLMMDTLAKRFKSFLAGPELRQEFRKRDTARNEHACLDLVKSECVRLEEDKSLLYLAMAHDVSLPWHMLRD